jgi:hypothetical protein
MVDGPLVDVDGGRQNGPSQNDRWSMVDGPWSLKWSITKWSMVDGRPWSMVDGRQNGPSQNGP